MLQSTIDQGLADGEQHRLSDRVTDSADLVAPLPTDAKAKINWPRLVELSRDAGKAEIAAEILHNVGNVLNTTRVAAWVVAESVRNSELANVSQAIALLEQNRSHLEQYLQSDQQGKLLLGYLRGLIDQLSEDRAVVIDELEVLLKNLDHIARIVDAHQDFSKVAGLIESVALEEVLEQAIQIGLAAAGSVPITIERNYANLPSIQADRHKLLQVLINVIRNAVQSMLTGKLRPSILGISTLEMDAARIAIEIADNGVGIPPANLDRIFNHGFTTKPTGHGFGLHNAAVQISEMGGTVKARSAGLGLGATLSIVLPCQAPREMVNA